MTTYDIGDLARLRIETRDELGALTNPTTVSITIRQPDGSTEVRDLGTGVVSEGTGKFRTDVDLTSAAPGTRSYRWETTGNPQLAEEGQFYVRPSAMAGQMPLPTAAAIRQASRLDFEALGYGDGTGATDPLDDVVGSAIAYVEQVTGRIPLTAMPEDLRGLAFDAVRMRTEQLALGLESASVEENIEATGGAGVQSFTVPGYSETRFGPEIDEYRKWINNWPALNDSRTLPFCSDARRHQSQPRTNGSGQM